MESLAPEGMESPRKWPRMAPDSETESGLGLGSASSHSSAPVLAVLSDCMCSLLVTLLVVLRAAEYYASFADYISFLLLR